MIRTTRHFTKFSNSGKLQNLNQFIIDYRQCAAVYLDFLWNNEISYSISNNKKCFNINLLQLDIPPMLSNVNIERNIENFQSDLSARARKCCLTQVLGIIRAVTDKQRKRIYQYDKTQDPKLLDKINDNKLTKPKISDINPELNSICCDFKKLSPLKFNGFVQLSSIGKKYGKIRIPIKFHRQNKKYSTWNLKPSFLIKNASIDFRWEHDVKRKSTGITLGVDQGALDVITLSNGITTPKIDHHGYSLMDIMMLMSRCRKGSSRFRRKQEQRKNFINWSINQLNLDKVQQLNLEKVVNIRYKRGSSRVMSHWANPLIRDKLKSRCEEFGVQVKEQSSVYCSQRCSQCGLVRKANRKGKVYSCSGCGNEIDADLNAALNHELELPEIPVSFTYEKHNRGSGFYWLESGFCDSSGEEFTVPLCPTMKDLII